MDDQDLSLRTSDEPLLVPPQPPRSPLAPRLLAVLLIAAVAITGYLVFRNRTGARVTNTPETAAPAQEPAAPASLGTEAEQVTIPPLDESDDAVRELVRQLSSNPSVTAWLMTKNLIRTFVAVVSNVATGERTTQLVPSLKPRGTFQVDERGEDLFVDPRSYSRYLPLTTAISSVDAAGAARLYATLKPRLDEAYRELGYPDTPFDQTLERAIVVLLRTPVPTGRVALAIQGGTSYRFADPALEKLTPSQKLLLRFGPDNQRSVQSSLRSIALALGIPAARLP